MRVSKKIAAIVGVTIVAVSGASIFYLSNYNQKISSDKDKETASKTKDIKKTHTGEKIEVKGYTGTTPPKVSAAPKSVAPSPSEDTEITGIIKKTSDNKYYLQDAKNSSMKINLDLSKYQHEISSFVDAGNVKVTGEIASKPTATSLEYSLLVSSIAR